MTTVVNSSSAETGEAKLLELVNIFEAAYWKSWREHNGAEPGAARVAGAEALVKVLSAPPQQSAETGELDRLRDVAWAAQGLLNADTYVSDVPRQEAVRVATEKLAQKLGTWQMHHTAKKAETTR